MRIVILVVLVATWLALSVRIDGIWPPAAAHHQVERIVNQWREPGMRLLATWAAATGASPESRARPPQRHMISVTRMPDHDKGSPPPEAPPPSLCG